MNQNVVIIIILSFLNLFSTQNLYKLNLSNSFIDVDCSKTGTLQIHVEALKKGVERLWSSSYLEITSSSECTITEESIDKENGLLYKTIEFSLRTLNKLMRNSRNEKCYEIVYLNLYKEHKIQVDSYDQVKARYHIQKIDWKLLSLFTIGLLAFYFADDIVKNTVFYYASGISLGVAGSVLLLFLIGLRLMPKKSTALITFLSGSTVFYFIGQWLMLHVKNLLSAYRWYVFGYLVIWALISFIYLYYHGRIENDKTLKLIEITLKICGLTCIYFGTSFQEIAFLVYITMILARLVQYIFEANFIKKFTHRYFPTKRKLLTNEDYIREGQEYTAKALAELREYCKSPDCNSWKILRRLKKPNRFVEFVDSGDHHVSQDEIMDYENYSINQDLIDEDNDTF